MEPVQLKPREALAVASLDAHLCVPLMQVNFQHDLETLLHEDFFALADAVFGEFLLLWLYSQLSVMSKVCGHCICWDSYIVMLAQEISSFTK